MAISILLCVLPFLLWNSLCGPYSKKQVAKIVLMSTVCLMTTWTSYQASTGIFLVMVLGLAFNDWLKQCKIVQIVKRVAIFLASFVLAALLFKFALPSYEGYRDTDMFAINDLIIGILRNIKRQLGVFVSSLNAEWRVLFVLFFVAFFISLFTFSTRKGVARITDVAVGILVSLALFPASFGAFIVLQNLNGNARTLIGMGTALAIIGILTTNQISKNWKTALALPGTVLLYSFVIFALAFGNGLADQERYRDFRAETLLNDLSHIYITKKEVSKTKLQIKTSDNNYSVVMKHVAEQYPIVETVMYTQHAGMGGNNLGYRKLVSYYNRPQKFVAISETTRFDCDSMKTLLDTYYHTIKSNDKDEVCVLLK
jgi:hypothetical protein